MHDVTTIVYTYTGDGLRVGQSANGEETLYAWDWASPVPELLSDGDAVYLVGHDTLGQLAEGVRTYYLPDALGSVRQTVDGAGAVVQAREWTPYGEEVGAAQAGLGYAGEWQDAAVGLVYLRARWYNPTTGRFTQGDPFPGLQSQPLSLHPYLYVLANPANLTDSAGLTSHLGLSAPDDDRDLTLWLYWELKANADGPDARFIRYALAGGPGYDKWQRLIWMRIGVAWWINLVKDRARWDFKHRIRQEIGQDIILFHGDGYRWYEYSVPGNIFYAYVGRAVGFTGLALHWGAGYAEVTDPAHKPGEPWYIQVCQSPDTCRLYIEYLQPCSMPVRDIGYFNPNWTETWFDNPGDYNNVEFGVRLYDTSGLGLTLQQFHTHLALYGDSLTPGQARQLGYRNPNWPYRVGYFDGPN